MTVNKYNEVLEELRKLEQEIEIGSGEEEISIKETLNNYFDWEKEELKEKIIGENNFENGTVDWNHLNNDILPPLSPDFYKEIGFTFKRGASYFPIISSVDPSFYVDFNNLPLGVSASSGFDSKFLYPFSSNSTYGYNEFSYSDLKCLFGKYSLDNLISFIPNTCLKSSSLSSTTYISRFLTLHFNINFLLEYLVYGGVSGGTLYSGKLLDVFQAMGKYIAFGFVYSYDGITWDPLQLENNSTYSNSKKYLFSSYLTPIYIDNEPFFKEKSSFSSEEKASIIISLPFNFYSDYTRNNTLYSFTNLTPIFLKLNNPDFSNDQNILNHIEFGIKRSDDNRKFESQFYKFKTFISISFGGTLKIPSSIFSTPQVFLETNNCSTSSDWTNNFSSLLNLSPSFGNGIFIKPVLYFPKFEVFYYMDDNFITSIPNCIGYFGEVKKSNVPERGKLSKIYIPTFFLALSDREIKYNYITSNRGFFIQTNFVSGREEWLWNV